MDIERNLWTTCLILVETTSTAPTDEDPDTVSDRTDCAEIEETMKPKKKKKSVNNLKGRCKKKN